MTVANAIRTAVGAQLASLCAPGQPLSAAGDRSTAVHYSQFDTSRVRLRRRLFVNYLDRHEEPAGSGSAIITAGVPGAGKSTMLRSVVRDLADYRRLDSDELKVDLIRTALDDGIFDDLLDCELADGRGIAPMELAPLVHNESTQLMDAVLTECVRRRENIVIEGTLIWTPLADRLYRQLAAADYEIIRVVALEVDQATAQEQALDRWWQGRVAWCEGRDALGGRYTPPEAVAAGYESDDTSRCSTNAGLILEAARDGVVDGVAVEIFRPNADGYDLISRRSTGTPA